MHMTHPTGFVSLENLLTMTLSFRCFNLFVCKHSMMNASACRSGRDYMLDLPMQLGNAACSSH